MALLYVHPLLHTCSDNVLYLFWNVGGVLEAYRYPLHTRFGVGRAVYLPGAGDDSLLLVEKP